MRKRVTGDVTAKAISGTHVVFLALDMDEADAKGLMGFAIQREDKTEREVSWLRGNKTFASVRAGSAFDDYISLKHPFQSFQWADYTVKPGYDYVYSVIPMFGKPGALKEGKATKVAISAEKPEGKPHSVYFNRGAIASQAYVKKFGLQDPEKVGQDALDWLARDLLPGMLAFIERAKDSSFGLHAAIYETKFAPVLEALADARKRKAKVHLVYSAKPGDDSTKLNKKAIKDAGLEFVAIDRIGAKIAHNKFIVLTRNDKPIAVWTGSTNLSKNAIYGQLNVGHAIDDAGLAKQFLTYWQELKDDPAPQDLKTWAEENDAISGDVPPPDLADVFSPHGGADAFDWYKEIAASARKGLFMTFPFGIVKDFRPVFDHNDSVIRYALLEKYVNGGSAASRAEAVKDTIRIRRLPNVGMALGSYITVPTIDGWLKERGGIGTNVNWVHTKFMLVDPLGSDPIVITGSANWSLPSVKDNDENMVIVRGDTRVADIYFTEFMRIFAHHRFREFDQDPSREARQPRRLETTGPVRNIEGMGAAAFQVGIGVRLEAGLFRQLTLSCPMCPRLCEDKA